MKNEAKYLGGDLGRIFYTGGRKPKGKLIHLLRLYEVIPQTELSGARERIEEELLIKPLRNNDHNHFRRLAEAIRDKDKGREWSPVQHATHFVFLACAMFEHRQQPLDLARAKDRARAKDLALKLWAQRRINDGPGEYIPNILDLSESEAVTLGQEVKKLKKLQPVVWDHIWKDTGLKEKEAG
jgi:hypothetical protein